MRILVWLVRAALFFVLLAFALNNQHEASIKWLFGYEWRTPMVFIVLAAFSLGCAFGVIAMLPSWWQQRRAARIKQEEPAADAESGSSGTAPPSDATLLRHEL